MRIKNFLMAVWLLPLIFLITQCSRQSVPDVKILRIGILPDQDRARLIHRFEPLRKYLERKTGLVCKLQVPRNYGELLRWFGENKVDLAYLGGATYVKAHQLHKAVPLVLRDIDLVFNSVVIVNRQHPAESLADLRGSRFSFGDRLSTSGHLMPRYFFEQKKIIAEKFFGKLKYSGSHTRTAQLVNSGTVDAGVANSKVIEKLFRNGVLEKTRVRVIWYSPPYANYVWSIQKNYPAHLRRKIRDAFLFLNKTNKKHGVILKRMDAGYYMPASHNQFIVLERITRKQLDRHTVK